jgi:hypothetical protein
MGGGAGGAGGGFSCSSPPVSCTRGTQYCSIFFGGAGFTGSRGGAGGGPFTPNPCTSFPTQCENDPTCTCLCGVLNCHTTGIPPFCTCTGTNGVVTLTCVSG